EGGGGGGRVAVGGLRVGDAHQPVRLAAQRLVSGRLHRLHFLGRLYQDSLEVHCPAGRGLGRNRRRVIGHLGRLGGQCPAAPDSRPGRRAEDEGNGRQHFPLGPVQG